MPTRYVAPRTSLPGRTQMPLTTAQQQAIINSRQQVARPGSTVQAARLPMVNSDRTIVFPTTSSRANYNAMAGMFGPNCVLFPGTLRSEVTLVATQQISFAVTEGAAPAASITEVRLPQNDAFIVEHMMIALSVQVTAEGVSTQVLHTFPDDKVFATTSLLAAKTFFNGRVTIQLNDVMYARGIDMMNFMRADSAQAGQTVSSVAVTGVQSTSSWEGNRAFKSLVPNIILNGTSTNNIVVQLPETATFTIASNTVRAVLMMRGIWAQNAGRMRSQ